MSDALLCRELVARLGHHPSTDLEIDLDSEDDATLGEWLIASCLLEARTPEPAVRVAFSSLRERGLTDIGQLASAEREIVAACLEAAELPKPESTAGLLKRLCASLEDRHRGSLRRLAASCDGLDELARELSALGAGFGQARIARFLRPLRTLWSLGDELPIEAAARSAGVHLGMLEDDLDPEVGIERLRRRLKQEEDADPASGGTPRLRDLEAALARLGRQACAPGRTKRCPLGDACPARVDAGRD